MSAEVHVVSHPLVLHEPTLLRQKNPSTSSYRRLRQEISMLMADEVPRDRPQRGAVVPDPMLATGPSAVGTCRPLAAPQTR